MKPASKSMSASLKGQRSLTSKDAHQNEVSGLKSGKGSGLFPGDRCTDTAPGSVHPSSAQHDAATLGKMVGGC